MNLCLTKSPIFKDDKTQALTHTHTKTYIDIVPPFSLSLSQKHSSKKECLNLLKVHPHNLFHHSTQIHTPNAVSEMCNEKEEMATRETFKIPITIGQL